MRTRSVTLTLITFFLLVGLLPAQEQKFALLGDFRLENGQVIKNLKVGYRSLGQLNHEKANAVLLPTCLPGPRRTFSI
jgi:homoserine O-acetyltransferase